MALERINSVIHPEKTSAQNPDRLALRARLLLGGENLNLKKHTSLTGIVYFDERDYTPIQQASDAERVDRWKGQTPDFNERMKSWTNHVVEAVKGSAELFEGAEGQKRRQLVEEMGLGTDTANEQAIKDSAKALYDYYLVPGSGTQQLSGIKLFVRDVLNLYYKPDQLLDYETIEKDLPVFAWMGGMFGGASSQIITEMIVGEAMLYSENHFKRDFLKELGEKSHFGLGQRRINRLTDEEKELLRFISSPPESIYIPEQYKQTLISTTRINLNTPKSFPVAPPPAKNNSDDEDNETKHPAAV